MEPALPELKLENYLVQSKESFEKENTWNGPINDESHFVECCLYKYLSKYEAGVLRPAAACGTGKKLSANFFCSNTV